MYDVEKMPYYCDDCDAWHVSLWSYDDKGRPIEGDEGGDWESTDEFPKAEEFLHAWHRYHEHVAETGDDPLCEFIVDTRKPKMVRWQFRVRRSIGGLCLCGARRLGRGKWLIRQQLPTYVREYFNLDEPGLIQLQDFAQGTTLEEFKAQCTDVEWQRDAVFAKGYVRIKEPLPEKDWTEELKKAARRVLRRNNDLKE